MTDKIEVKIGEEVEAEREFNKIKLVAVEDKLSNGCSNCWFEKNNLDCDGYKCCYSDYNVYFEEVKL